MKTLKTIEIEKMGIPELMEFLKEAINRYKYDRLTYEEFVELEQQIDYGIERLEAYSTLFSFPFRLQLGKY